VYGYYRYIHTYIWDCSTTASRRPLPQDPCAITIVVTAKKRDRARRPPSSSRRLRLCVPVAACDSRRPTTSKTRTRRGPRSPARRPFRSLHRGRAVIIEGQFLENQNLSGQSIESIR